MPLAESLKAAREVARKDLFRNEGSNLPHVEVLPSMSSAAHHKLAEVSRANKKAGPRKAHKHVRKAALMVQPGGNIAPVVEDDSSHDFSILNSGLVHKEVTGQAAILEHLSGFNTKSKFVRMKANQRLHSLPSWHATQRHQPVAAASNLVAPVLPVAAPALMAVAAPALESLVAAAPAQENAAMDPSVMLAFVCGALAVAVLVCLAILLFSTEQIVWLRQKLLGDDNQGVRGVNLSEATAFRSEATGARFSTVDGEYWHPEMSEQSEEEAAQEPTREVSSRDMQKGAVKSGFLWKLANDVVRELPKESWEKMLERPLEIAEWTSWRIRYFNIKVTDEGAVDMSYLSEKDDLIPVSMQLNPLQISGKFVLELPSVHMHGDDETKLATMASVTQYKLSIVDLTENGGALPDVLYLLLVSGTKADDLSGKKKYHVYGVESKEECLEWIANIEASGQRDM